MRFPLDVIFLDVNGEQVGWRRLRPWRVARCRGADAVLEVPAADRSLTRPAHLRIL
jgi:uncharacterized membrane protein (UPF0127 family)